jgi:DNA-binding MarR family transcriptional regulator
VTPYYEATSYWCSYSTSCGTRTTPLEAEIVAAIRNRKSLSRSELARIVGYSRANMTPVVSKLLHTGILNEQGKAYRKVGVARAY